MDYETRYVDFGGGFKASVDKNGCWHLTCPTGPPDPETGTTPVRLTYHPDLGQVCKRVVERSLENRVNASPGDTGIAAVGELISDAARDILAALKVAKAKPPATDIIVTGRGSDGKKVVAKYAKKKVPKGKGALA